MSRTCWLWACACLCIAAAPLSSQRAAFRVAICVVSCSELWALSAETLPWSQTCCFESLKRFPISIYFQSELKCLRKEVASLAGRHVYRDRNRLGARSSDEMGRVGCGEEMQANPQLWQSQALLCAWAKSEDLWIGIEYFIKYIIRFELVYLNICELDFNSDFHLYFNFFMVIHQAPLAPNPILGLNHFVVFWPYTCHTSLSVRNCESLVSHTKGTVRQSLPVTSQACLGL